ncbi:MAG: 50S ribosomal protein L15 [Saprospiraceae bacterium]|nr:50S ribosomal protein L15 [Bacteroidia bacterium]NNE16057.1 50S ribosomal protein L15 [Saprospiraceae bacterium]NNL91258.1 50S ribosomal protein L15 [Saprospiraceae bacterium]
MKLHNLSPAKGSVKRKKRIARGQGSGHGGTSTRGHKGAKSRSGYSRKRAFEGGQMPLQMRLPKRGFNNPNRTSYVALNLSRLQEMLDKYGMADVSVESLYENRFIKKNDKVKVLGNGDLNGKVNVTVHAISKTAQEKIESAGGTVTIL